MKPRGPGGGAPGEAGSGDGMIELRAKKGTNDPKAEHPSRLADPAPFPLSLIHI